jgi:hypothetical protein
LRGSQKGPSEELRKTVPVRYRIRVEWMAGHLWLGGGAERWPAPGAARMMASAARVCFGGAVITGLIFSLAVLGAQSDPDPVCRAEVRWVNTSPAAVSPTSPLTLTLFSVLNGRSACGSAQVLLNTTYLDAGEQVLCTGMIRLANHGRSPTIVILELQPSSWTQFARWVNRPGRAIVFEPLQCVLPDGVTPAHVDVVRQAASLRLHATTIADYGALSVADLSVKLQP